VAIGVEPAQVRGIRPVVAANRKKAVTGVAALIEQEGRVLVAQRRADQARPLAWEFPGGKVEPGGITQPGPGARNRGGAACSIEVGAVVDVVFFAYDAFDLIMPVYRASIRAGVPVARQVAGRAWVARAELPTLAFTPADVPLASPPGRRTPNEGELPRLQG